MLKWECKKRNTEILVEAAKSVFSCHSHETFRAFLYVCRVPLRSCSVPGHFQAIHHEVLNSTRCIESCWNLQVDEIQAALNKDSTEGRGLSRWSQKQESLQNTKFFHPASLRLLSLSQIIAEALWLSGCLLKVIAAAGVLLNVNMTWSVNSRGRLLVFPASGCFRGFSEKKTKRTWLCAGISPVRYALQTR